MILKKVLAATICMVFLCSCQYPHHKARGSAGSSIRLAVLFDEGMYGCEGAANPFPAWNNVKIVENGRHGKAARLESIDSEKWLGIYNNKNRIKSTIIFDGKNIPAQHGTIGFYLRTLPKKNCWKDSKEYWLAVLVPDVGIYGDTLGQQGTGLALVKEKDNTVAIRIYQFFDNKKRRYPLSNDFGGTKYKLAEPDKTLIKIPVHDLDANKWVLIRFAWDQMKNRVWLSINEKTVMKECIFRPCRFLTLLVGMSPKPYHSTVLGFCGDIDDLVVDERTMDDFPSAGVLPSQQLTAMAQPLTEMEPATLLTKDPWAAELESMIRTHFRMVIDNQKCGGWAFSIAWPSMMRFLSGGCAVPFPDNFFGGTKARNSSFTAMWLAAGYEILGHKQFLTAAEKTAETLMITQQTDGSWRYGALFANGIVGPDFKIWGKIDEAPIQDNVQTYPIILLMYLHLLTGKKEYLAAAEKGAGFLLAAQNPNGSWSHAYNVVRKCGVGARKHIINGGEINDYATTAAMNIMLLMYRRTANIEYLASFLKGAEWILSAFIDEGAVGWAQQYDARNKPVWARHSEPPAVSLSEGIIGVPDVLFTAFRITGEKKYLTPLKKWFAWLKKKKEKKAGKEGWYSYYDIKTGRPISAFQNKITFIDQKSQGKLYNPGIERFQKTLEEIEQGAQSEPYVPNKTNASREFQKNKELVETTMKRFDKKIGNWPYEFLAAGTVFHPGRWCVERLLWAALNKRMLCGQIPWTHRLANRRYIEDWNIFSLVIKKDEMQKRIDANVLEEARALP